MLILLSGCAYTPQSRISMNTIPDGVQVKEINGKQYVCYNETDGTFKCVELEQFVKKLQGNTGANASERSFNSFGNGRLQKPNER